MSQNVPISTMFLMYPTPNFQQEQDGKSFSEAVWDKMPILTLAAFVGAHDNNKQVSGPQSEVYSLFLHYTRTSLLARIGQEWEGKHKLWEDSQSSRADPWGFVRKPFGTTQKGFSGVVTPTLSMGKACVVLGAGDDRAGWKWSLDISVVWGVGGAQLGSAARDTNHGRAGQASHLAVWARLELQDSNRKKSSSVPLLNYIGWSEMQIG